MHQLLPLPYGYEALAPVISPETLKLHHDKHHRAYIDKLNELIKGTAQERMSLEEIILEARGPVYNNAAQAWNHAFFWKCLTPETTAFPVGPLANKIYARWGNLRGLKEAFKEVAAKHFGSGWIWLVQNRHDVEIIATHDADNPIKFGKNALLTLDVWEHAYYLDYQNRRPDFIDNFWSIVNWEFVSSQWED